MEPVLDHTSEIISMKDDELAVFSEDSVQFSTISGDRLTKMPSHQELH
jgi:hypothetical protein